MDALTFIVEVIKATAWPLTILVFVGFFQREIRGLVARIKKGKLGPTEFEFERAVAEIQSEASQDPELPKVQLTDSAIEMARSDPRAAILNSWLEVQSEVDRLVQIPSSEVNLRSTGSISLRVLHREFKGKLEYINMYNELKELRNQAVHDFDFNPRPESVLNYVELSKRLVNVLRALPEST